MFRYTVSENDFLDMARHLLMQQRKKPISVVKLVFATVVQMGVVAYLVFFPNEVPTWMRILMGILSLIWAGLAFFRFFFLDARARMMLKQQNLNDKDGDFWKEHKLSLKGNEVSISYGSASAEMNCREISQIEKAGSVTLLMKGWNVFEVVPEKITETGDWQRFLDDIEVLSENELRRRQEEARSKVLHNAVFTETMPLTEEEVTEHIVAMKRRSYLYPFGWSTVSSLLFAVPIVFGILSAVNRNWDYVLLCLLFFVMMNSGQVMTFTPLYYKVVRKRVEPAPDDGYLLAVASKKVYLFTRRKVYSYEVANLKKTVLAKDALYVYFKDQEMIFVPLEYAAAFKEALAGRRKLSEMAKLPDADAAEEESAE